MGKRILFSPIGGTDPIKYQHDGSLLHICRVYRPDVVYMYLSHEMLELSRKDDRYRYTLERLGEKLGHTFEINLIERENLVNVQEYDIFYCDFRDEIMKIEKEMSSDDELILNMASGTPAMKSALMVMATLAEYRFRVIQVATPQKMQNIEYENRDEYDPELNWEYDLDNEENFDNRCKEVHCFNLMRLLKMETIKKHLLAYDYPAALSIAKEIREDLNEDILVLLNVVAERVKLNRKKISKLMPAGKYDIFPIKEGNKQKIFEYALVLQLKLYREEYADFIRAVTPIVVDLLENILKICCNIMLDDFCFIDKKTGCRKWDNKKLAGTEILKILDEKFKSNGGFKCGPVYSVQLAELIVCKCDNPQIKQSVQDIIAIESKVRNLAAHEIVSVTDEWFQSNTGKTVKEIMKIIKDLVRMSGINATEKDWASYDTMNEMIIKLLAEA